VVQRQQAKWQSFLGIELSPVSHTEKIVSAVGGFLGIYCILQISIHFVGHEAATLIVASMGASAVLVFAVPHGPLSQLWPVIGGHLLSAIIGVSCYKLVPEPTVAAALAVAIAIGVMHYLRCIHPPGGATALSAVVGGPALHQMGYQFVLTPVMINVAVIVSVAIGFNYLFSWRRYPAHFKQTRHKKPVDMPTTSIGHEDLVYALSEVDSFIDVSEQDLLAIYELATGRAEAVGMHVDAMKLGSYYSNGKYGAEWSVRQIVDESGHSAGPEDRVIFKVVAGMDRRSSGVATREQFARWARHEVYRDDENWCRVDPAQAEFAG